MMSTPNVPTLDLRGVSYAVDGLTILHELDLTITTGERVGLWGRNGTGKSTLLKIICGWLRPNSGCVRLFDHDVTQWPAHRRFAAGLAEVPQSPELSPELSAREILALATATGRRRQGRDPKWTTATMRPCLSHDVLDQAVKNLSFGARKILAIEAALASEPRLLLVDEPTAGLDDDQIDVLVNRLLSGSPVPSMIVIEHRPAFLHQVCTRELAVVGGAVISRQGVRAP